MSMKKPRFFRCFLVAFLVFSILPPFVACFLPGGGVYEQVWLDEVVAHLKLKRIDCQDEYILKAIDLTLEKYTVIKPFGVKVLQLPEGIDGVNNVLCPGVTIDSSILMEGVAVGALVLVHETMHDMPPYIGHTHIDNDRILKVIL